MAKSILKAANFNKDNVFTRVGFLKKSGDVYATDLMYHAKCLQKYIKKINKFLKH